MTIRRGRYLAVGAVLLLLVAVVAVLRATGGDPAPPDARPTPATASPAADAPVVIVPGRPGEPAVTRPAAEVRPTTTPAYNTLDVSFVRMMIPHHAQAVEMAALAPERAADPAVRALADRIRASQTPELGVLRGWLQLRGLPPDVPGHDHGTMRGMQTPEALRRLAAARGAEFDRLFVAMMTAHHQGAVEMATNLLSVGVDRTLSEFATSVAVEQNVEIDRMRDLLAP